jgi:CHAT domain
MSPNEDQDIPSAGHGSRERAGRAESLAVLRELSTESPYRPDGSLPDGTVEALLSLEPAELGQALTFLLRRAAELPPLEGARAAEAIDGLLTAGAAPAVELEIAALTGIYGQLVGDASRRDISDLIVRLLRKMELAAVLAPIGFDARGLDLRARLAAAIRGPAAAPGRATRGMRLRGADPGGVVLERGSPDHAAPGLGAPDLAAPEDVAADDGDASKAAPTRRTYPAYGLLKSDETVLAERPFALELGISPTPQPGVPAQTMRLPVPDGAAYMLDIQLFADGFDIARGERWRQSLKIREGDLYPPPAVVHLTARTPPDARAKRTITATFSIASETLGAATREIVVTTDPNDPDLTTTATTASGTNIATPTGEPPADITITITKGIEPGALLWSLASELPGVTWPVDREIKTDVGQQPEKFARVMIADLHSREGTNRVFAALQGMAKIIADEVPPEVWTALAAAHEAVPDRHLDVFILTAEPYVPWELAWVETPLDPKAPQYLAAQANVGRWVIAGEKVRTDPPRKIDAATMAVVWGVFDDPTLERLKAAEDEAKEIQARYRADSIDATSDLVGQLLSGNPPADVLHFAVHGKYDPQMATEGLYLVEGLPISVVDIRGGDLRSRAPFVFINACEVGEGHELLGDYTGIAPALLKAGASAVVAPLWQVNDVIAKSIALGFYDQALMARAAAAGDMDDAKPAPAVADLLRQTRAGIVTDAAACSSTYLAYQFYGHPSLRLSWTQAIAAGGNPDG